MKSKLQATKIMALPAMSPQLLSFTMQIPRSETYLIRKPGVQMLRSKMLNADSQNTLLLSLLKSCASLWAIGAEKKQNNFKHHTSRFKKTSRTNYWVENMVRTVLMVKKLSFTLYIYKVHAKGPTNETNRTEQRNQVNCL